jgi:Flp pilus assembly secretin CpaC
MKSLSRLFILAFFLSVAIAVVASEPQVHIKTRFLEVSEKEFQDFVATNLFTNSSAKSGTNGWAELLTDEKFKSVLRALEAEPGIETLGEPEVVTASGRQT